MVRRSTSRHIGADEKTYYDARLLNQAYGSDGRITNPMDFNINLLQGFYGTKSETIVFYDMEKEKLKKSLEDDKEELME